MDFSLFNIFDRGFVIEAEAFHTLEKLFDGDLGVFVAMFGEELCIVGDKLAIRAFSRDKFHIFELDERALHSVRVDLRNGGKVTDGRQTPARRDFARNDVELKLLNDLEINRAAIIKIEFHRWLVHCIMLLRQ